MVYIERIEKGSPAEKSGLCAGDYIVSAKRNIIKDALDVEFYIEGEQLIPIKIERSGREFELTLRNRRLEPSGIVPRKIGLRRCSNKCIFCFIDQQPKGLRKSLYIKDEDIRHSFLHCNYITLTNTPKSEIERVVAQKMSPIYISVHSTDEKTRRILLGNNDIPPILPLLDKLASSGIQLHTQIVVVPGYNDGAVLERTIKDLAALGENVLSCAVVPVGLTKYRSGLSELRSLSRKDAQNIVSTTGIIRKDISRAAFLQLADEIFFLADYEIPKTKFYGDFPQLDNGVGLTRLFLDDAARCRKKLHLRVRKSLEVAIVTGIRAVNIISSAMPGSFYNDSIHFSIVPVQNRFWGKNVTAANLLVGKDIYNIISKSKSDIFFLPPKIINKDGLFLDGMSIDWLRARVSGQIVEGFSYLSEIQNYIRDNF